MLLANGPHVEESVVYFYIHGYFSAFWKPYFNCHSTIVAVYNGYNNKICNVRSKKEIWNEARSIFKCLSDVLLIGSWIKRWKLDWNLNANQMSFGHNSTNMLHSTNGQRVQLVESINKERFWMKTLNQIWLRLNYNVINTYLRQTWRRRRCSMLYYVQYRQFLHAGIYPVHSRYVRVLHLSVDCHILNAMENICHNFHYIPRWYNYWSLQSCRIHNFYTLRTRNWKQTKQLVQCYAQDSSMPATLKSHVLRSDPAGRALSRSSVREVRPGCLKPDPV